MARVVFPDHLRQHTNGTEEVQVECNTYRSLVKNLESQYPGIEEILEKTAVAIDGQIYQDAWLEPIQPNAEVFFLHRIEGG